MGDHDLTLEQPTRLDRCWQAFRFGVGLAGMFLSTVVLTLAVLASVAPLAPRWSATVVASGSMEPALRRGDVVVYAGRAVDEVGVGSVVVFDSDGRSLVHRVDGIAEDGSLVTKGDANAVRDSGTIDDAELAGAGELVVPWIGLPRLWWHEGHYILVVASAVALLVALRSSRLTSDPANDPWAGQERRSPIGAWADDREPRAPGDLIPAHLLEPEAA